jgi:hypothetical protein
VAVKIHKSDGRIVTVREYAADKKPSDTRRTSVVLSDGGALSRKLKDALDRAEPMLKTIKPRR